VNAQDVRQAIGQALEGVRGDFSRAQARDAAWSAVLPLLDQGGTGVTIHPGDAVLVRDGDRELVFDPADVTVARLDSGR
jgi:hypothetical protein